MERSQNYRIKFSHLVVFYFLALNVVAHFKFFFIAWVFNTVCQDP